MSDRAKLWKKLDDDASEEAIDSAAKVSVEEAEARLKAAGFDTKAERAKAEAAIAALLGAGGGAKEEADATGGDQVWVRGQELPPRRARASSRVVWLVAAVVAATIAGGAVYGLARRPKLRDDVPEPPPPAPTASAATPVPVPAPTAPARPPAGGTDPFSKMPPRAPGP
jgi:hypothetical protein